MSNIKKKVLMFTDNPTQLTGIGGMAKHICIQLLKNNFEVTILAVCQISPGSPPKAIYKTDDGDFKVQITDSFNNVNVLFSLMQEEKPDVLILSQDLHFYYPLFQHTPAIRKNIPIVFLSIWDTQLTSLPNGIKHYNYPFYESCDGIGCVSRQTYNFVTEVLNHK